MVEDHTKANDKLKQVAQQKGVSLPDQLEANNQKLVDQLKALSGSEFDKQYMAAMVRDHRADIEEFSREAEKGHDADVKNFASDTLPVLREHLKLAEAAARAVGAPVNTPANGSADTGSRP
jgi:putative membrane protein